MSPQPRPTRFAVLTTAALAPVTRLHAILVDPARREQAMPLLLLAYVLVWALYGALAKGGQDLHFDMVEGVAWSREPALGYTTHPPLAAWIVGLWFKIFPLTDWAFYLLAMANAGLGLWLIWRLSARWLDPDKRLLGLALLTFVPFFNFLALKFNPNTILIPLWAVTTTVFIRSYETRAPLFAALAGLAAAACMYGKYWSVFLLAGLALAALIDPRRRDYFSSSAPWITVAVGGLALGPHLAWLVANDFSPFSHAVVTHGGKGVAATLGGVLGYLVGAVAYVAVPVAFVMIVLRPGKAALADMTWPAEPERRLLALVFWLPILLPVVVAPAIGAKIGSLWTMSALALLPVVLLSSPLIAVGRAVVPVLGVALLFPVVMTAAAPAIAAVIHRYGPPDQSRHMDLLARAVTGAWRETSEAPLGLVGGTADVAYGVAFHLPERPLAIDILRPLSATSRQRIARHGAALACRAGHAACTDNARALAAANPKSRETVARLARSHLGHLGEPVSYVIVTIPPG